MRIVGKLSCGVAWGVIVFASLLTSAPVRAQDGRPGDAATPADPSQDETIAPYRDKISAVLAARPGGLTADEAAEKAAARSPEVAMREADMALADARTTRTLAGYLPKLELSAGWQRRNAANVDFTSGGFLVGALNEGALAVGNCPDGTPGCIVDTGGIPVASISVGGVQTPPNSYTTQANLVLPLSDYVLSLGKARKASEKDKEAARGQRDVALAQAGADARVAYYEWVRTVAQVAVAEQAVAGAKARLEDARLGLEGGLLAPADILQIETTLASTQLAVSNATSFRELARNNLAVLMGETDREFVIGEDVLNAPVALPGVDGDGSLVELLERARERRGEVQAFAATIRAAELGLDSASAALYPRVDGIVNVTYANPNPQFFPPSPEWNASWFVGVTASWALDRFYLTKAQLAEVRANIKALNAQRDLVVRGIELEVAAAWQAWQRARASLALSRTELAAAEAAYSQRVVLYRGGEATTTDIVEAEIQRHNATLRNIGARIDLHVARAKLVRAAVLTDEPRAPGAAGSGAEPGRAPTPAGAAPGNPLEVSP